MKQKLSSAMGMIITLCVFLTFPVWAEPSERPLVEYYYENYCDSCAPEREFIAEFEELTGESLENYRYQHYNVVKESGKQALEEAAEKYGLGEGRLSMPLVVVNGRVYMGSSEIYKELPVYGLERSDSTDSVLYYLYVAACESCARASELLNALPNTVNVTRGDYTFESKLRIERVDIGRDTQLAYALFDAFSVPEEKRLAPLVLAGDSYYQGVERIEFFIRYSIGRGKAIGTLLITEKAQLPVLKWSSVFSAGLVGGLNPCALSMLLLFLTMLMNMKKNVAKLAAVFLLSKLITYLLIGTLFLGIFQLWNPTWLPMFTKLLLTAFSVIFIVLNLRDAWMASKEQYGKIKNQLPPTLRKGLQTHITNAMQKATGHAGLIIAALGALVAAGEFLCSGQVYLATLLASIQMGEHLESLILMLLIYCAAFLLPSAALCAIVARGRSAFEVSEFMRRHMPVVKLITALFFAVLLAIVWLL